MPSCELDPATGKVDAKKVCQPVCFCFNHFNEQLMMAKTKSKLNKPNNQTKPNKTIKLATQQNNHGSEASTLQEILAGSKMVTK
jgi:hypothetical protein